ncbi:MAG: hypothetical protein HFJ55_05900 [Clostridia bacterium]|nr:hypothetical protein [Clostridia bacterium]
MKNDISNISLHFTPISNMKIKDNKIDLAAIYGGPYWIRNITLEEVNNVPEKGTSLEGTVADISQNAYPNSGEKGGYWYEFKGIQ